MSKIYPCCNLCFHYLAKQSTNLTSIWMAICSSAKNFSNPFRLPEHLLSSELDSNLKALEAHSFILTLDQDKNILIKAIGEKNDKEIGLYYCPRGCSESMQPVQDHEE